MGGCTQLTSGTLSHKDTQTHNCIFTNTSSHLAFLSNQFSTLLSETYFNVPVLFLLPLLFNTLLNYPLIWPSLHLLHHPSFFLSHIYLLWAFTDSLAEDPSHHAFRFQLTGDLTANSFNKQQHYSCSRPVHAQVNMSHFSEAVVGMKKEIGEMLQNTDTTTAPLCICL